MLNVLCKCLSNRKGFTLIEVLVVLVIIALLLSTSVPLYSTVIAKAEETTHQANLRNQNLASISHELFHPEVETLSVDFVVNSSETLPATEENKEEDNDAYEWKGTSNYKIGDFVNYNGVIYRAITAAKNKQPDLNPKHWHVYVI